SSVPPSGNAEATGVTRSSSPARSWPGNAAAPSPAELAPPPRTQAMDAPRADRPGLGTSWGETRFSPVHDVAFDRGPQPPSLLSVYYNDREGAEAMAQRDALLAGAPVAPLVVRGGVRISVLDEEGGPLPAFQ